MLLFCSHAAEKCSYQINVMLLRKSLLLYLLQILVGPLVKASRSFFITLLAMFMFQAIWNVAAGFCLHEENTRTLSNQHFGHHQANLCESDQVKKHSAQDPVKTLTASDLSTSDLSDTDQTRKLFDDHHDHLPSFAHFIVAEAVITQHWPILAYAPHLGDVVWNNLYQSPHLASQNPPPELTSL